MKYDSDYSIRLKMVEQMGGDVTKKYDSVYSIDLEILRLMEEGGGGGNSAKVVKINFDWYNNPDNYQTEIKKAFEDIYNEVSNNRTVTVMCNGFYSQKRDSILETTNVISKNKNDVTAYFLGDDKHLLRFSITYNEGSKLYRCGAGDEKLVRKDEIDLPYIYKDGKMNLDKNGYHLSEFISEPTVDNEEFVVLKTTVKAYSGTDTPHHQIYYGISDNTGVYYLSKFCGMKLSQDRYNANYDLIPDGEWYVIFNEIQAATYTKIIVTKAVRNVDGTLDVYLGFKGYDLNSISFYDCTVENKDSQGGVGKWNEKNWVKVSDAQNISVDSFIGIRTRYFCTNTEGVKVDSLTLFKRIK